jgi:hypothetical protein
VVFTSQASGGWLSRWQNITLDNSQSATAADGQVFVERYEILLEEREWCALVDVIRTHFRQEALNLYSIFPDEAKNWLGQAMDDLVKEFGKTSTRTAVKKSYHLRQPPILLAPS